MMKKLIGYYNYTVILTYAGLGAAIAGIFLAAGGRGAGAVICLLIAGVCDMFDGKIASTMTRTRQEKDFGIQIDSLCDIVSFGVLPAMIGWAVGLRHWTFILVGAVYTLCGVIRLAYYNVTENERQRVSDGRRETYQGLPISTVGLLIPLLYCLRDVLGRSFGVVYIIALLLFAALFIWPFSLKKPGGKVMALIVILGLAALVLILITLLR